MLDNENVDVWSLGVTLIEMAEKNPPHHGVKPFSAMFLITYKPAPTFTKPQMWSPEMIDFLSQCLEKDPHKRSSSKSITEHSWFKKEVATLRKQQQSKMKCSLPELTELAKRSIFESEKKRQTLKSRTVDDDDYGNDVEMVEDMDTLTWDENKSRMRGGSLERIQGVRQEWQTTHFNVSHAKGTPIKDDVKIDVSKLSNKNNGTEAVTDEDDDDVIGPADTFVYRKASLSKTTQQLQQQQQGGMGDDDMDTIEISNGEALRSQLNAQLEASLRIDKIDLNASSSASTTTKIPPSHNSKQSSSSSSSASRDSDTNFLIKQLEQLDTSRTDESDASGENSWKNTMSAVPNRTRTRSSTVNSIGSNHTLKSTQPSHGGSSSPKRRKSFVIEIPDKFVDVVDRLEDILYKMDDMASAKFTNNDNAKRVQIPSKPSSSSSTTTKPVPPPIKTHTTASAVSESRKPLTTTATTMPTISEAKSTSTAPSIKATVASSVIMPPAPPMQNLPKRVVTNTTTAHSTSTASTVSSCSAAKPTPTKMSSPAAKATVPTTVVPTAAIEKDIIPSPSKGNAHVMDKVLSPLKAAIHSVTTSRSRVSSSASPSTAPTPTSAVLPAVLSNAIKNKDSPATNQSRK